MPVYRFLHRNGALREERLLGQIRGWSGPDRLSSAACLARSAVCAVTKSPDGRLGWCLARRPFCSECLQSVCAICAANTGCWSSRFGHPLAEGWSAQALNLCKFPVGFDLDRKGLAVAHGTELKVLSCAELHLNLLEPKFSDDSLCPFTGDR
jgi:hypothetical protein